MSAGASIPMSHGPTPSDSEAERGSTGLSTTR